MCKFLSPLMTSLVTVGLLVPCLAQSAESPTIYRDKQGKVHLSDRAPEGNQYTIVEPVGGYSASSARAATPGSWAWQPASIAFTADTDTTPRSVAALVESVNKSVWIVLAASTGSELETMSELLDRGRGLVQEKDPEQELPWRETERDVKKGILRRRQGSPEAGASLGSAVAVGQDTLLTNCHVVKKRSFIRVRQGKTEARARVIAGDEAYDRCVLAVEGQTLQPVRGYRRFVSLAIGEKVYTLGSPLGLENSLGEGIISGLRNAKERHLIQTTAQISPGSSGGGLFDAAGNLIGITTFKVLGPGMEGLNFAIAVEDYTQ